MPRELAAHRTVFENLAESLSRQLSRPAFDGCGSVPRRESIDGFLAAGWFRIELRPGRIPRVVGFRAGVVVREIFQMSFAQRLRFHRMEYARLLLVNTTLPLHGLRRSADTAIRRTFIAVPEKRRRKRTRIPAPCQRQP
jgi:hypothetical protein